MRGPMEKAFKYVYNFKKRAWLKSMCLISMENQAFDEGAMRLCFRMTDWTAPEGERDFVVCLDAPPALCGSTMLVPSWEQGQECIVRVLILRDSVS